MKIKRFIAPNMREAMRLVREEQGPDAVILSNRRVEGGIEVVAATDYDAALVQSAALRPETITVEAPRARAEEPARDTRTLPVPPPPAASTIPPAPQPAQPVPPTPHVQHAQHAWASQAAGLMQEAPGIDTLRREMREMRRLMEQQLAGLAWNDLKTRNPIRADVVRRLSGMGVELKLAREIAAELPDNTSAERARFLPLAALARRIPAHRDEWLDQGGVIALVGATGVGKTTTIAKLAARYVQSWGLRDVALVTTDHFRIGAQEQLFTYGRLLGVPVLTADNQQELCQALDKLRDRKLVLIDTAGMSPRDGNLEKQFAMLSGLPVANRTALVLSASSQPSDLDAQFARFAPADPDAVILTKLDESSRIGSALSAVVRHGLPLAYVTDGQRVPEDLSCASPDHLVMRAMQAATRSAETVDDDELHFQFAGAAHA